jgi:hypothetical protein
MLSACSRLPTRAVAQARVDQLKADLATQVANSLTGALNRSFSLYENWFDPFIGLRGRYNLTKAFYLTAETDFGGFANRLGDHLAGIRRPRLPDYPQYLF